jgi:hypothetical protein
MGKNKQLVLAFFDTEVAAEAAVYNLKQWDKASQDIKLGSIGFLVKDDKGKIKTHKMGSRKTGTGVVVGVIVGILSGGVSLLGGAIAGGIIGAFFHKGLGLSKEDLSRIDGELNGGKAAVCILVEPEEAASVTARLAELGGKPETHEVTEEALAQATTAIEATPEEPAAPAAEAPAEKPAA